MFEAQGTDEDPSNRMSRLVLLSKDPGQEGPGQGETPAIPPEKVRTGVEEK